MSSPRGAAVLEISHRGAQLGVGDITLFAPVLGLQLTRGWVRVSLLIVTVTALRGTAGAFWSSRCSRRSCGSFWGCWLLRLCRSLWLFRLLGLCGFFLKIATSAGVGDGAAVGKLRGVLLLALHEGRPRLDRCRSCSFCVGGGAWARGGAMLREGWFINVVGKLAATSERGSCQDNSGQNLCGLSHHDLLLLLRGS